MLGQLIPAEKYHLAVGRLDDEIARQTEAERSEVARRADAERFAAESRARASAEDQDFVRDFVRRALAAGIKPTYRVEVVESESRYEWVKHWSGHQSQFWSTPREIRRTLWRYCWNLGGSPVSQGISEYLLSEEGTHVVPGPVEIILEEEGKLGGFFRTAVSPRRVVRTTWREEPAGNASITASDGDGGSYEIGTVFESMARLIRTAESSTGAGNAK